VAAKLSERLRDHFSVVYITIVSIMLGLALDDAVSVVRDVGQLDLFTGLTAAFSIIVIFNAWVGYSMSASVARLVPSVWDALNVFALSFAHFALNTAIGKAPIVFFVVAGVYAGIAGIVIYYNVRRINQDPDIDYDYRIFRKLIVLNAAGALAFLLTALFVYLGQVPTGMQVVLVALGIPFAVAWLVVFLTVWRKSGLPVWNKAQTPMS
jgi:hypothetical protein